MDISTGYPSTTLVPATHWGDSHSHAHSVQFYGDDAFLIDDLTRFLGSALGGGSACVVIATKAHRNQLARRLKSLGLDIGFAARQGRYISLDAAETLSKFMLDGKPDAAHFSEVVGAVLARAAVSAEGEPPRVAAFGEMVALLWAEGNCEAALHLEQLWNDLSSTHSFDLHCAYPMSLFPQAEDGRPIENICAAHSHVVPTESYTSLVSEDERLRAIALLQQKAHALEREIEERKRVEQALRERNEELRAALAARDEFMSVAAHELKTPVTSLRGFAQLLLRDIQRKQESTPERIESALRAVELQTEKLNRLMGRLLDSAQIEAGKLRIEPARTDLAALVHGVLAHKRHGAGHTFVFEGPDHLDAVVDPVRFEQVITNLLDNAVKFSPRGGVITIKLGLDNSIWLSVTDQGMGISPDQREAVFGRFYQSHSGEHLSGMGLGLYITQEIINLHGGSIRIEEPEHPALVSL
jgi:signal transduction histidine kinase